MTTTLLPVSDRLRVPRHARAGASVRALFVCLGLLALPALVPHASATDRYWSGYGSSDNIDDNSNWYSPGKPNSGDNLNWNNTAGSHHYSYFNYGDYYTFGTIMFYNNAGGGQLYGNALQFTAKLENNSDPNQWRVYNSNVAVNSNGSGSFEVNPVGGDLYFKLDGSGGQGNSSGGSFYFNGNTMNVYGANNHLLTLECILANGSGTGSFALQQNSQVRFAGTAANTYSGSTTINAGTLYLNKTAGVTAVAGNIAVNNTGSLVLEASNQIADTSAMTLNGGTFNVGGKSEGTQTAVGLGALTLSSNSVINLSGTSLLHFSDSHSISWTGTLSVYNWNGTAVAGGGSEQLLFGVNTSSLTQTQLNSIMFYSDSGTTLLGRAGFASIGDGEIVPVPEPAAWAGGALCVGLALWTVRRRVLARAA